MSLNFETGTNTRNLNVSKIKYYYNVIILWLTFLWKVRYFHDLWKRSLLDYCKWLFDNEPVAFMTSFLSTLFTLFLNALFNLYWLHVCYLYITYFEKRYTHLKRVFSCSWQPPHALLSFKFWAFYLQMSKRYSKQFSRRRSFLWWANIQKISS